MEDRVKLAVGETKEIILDSNPTTGYSWSIIRSDGLEVIEEFISDDTNGPVCGAGP
ncbi:MAG: protease inhibitor I42 family protein [Methanomassiliicoccales archaeon]|nr:protease inhibitor I42 family protein [Methanomassiliicoccales archaeon]